MNVCNVTIILVRCNYLCSCYFKCRVLSVTVARTITALYILTSQTHYHNCTMGDTSKSLSSDSIAFRKIQLCMQNVLEKGMFSCVLTSHSTEPTPLPAYQLQQPVEVAAKCSPSLTVNKAKVIFIFHFVDFLNNGHTFDKTKIVLRRQRKCPKQRTKTSLSAVEITISTSDSFLFIGHSILSW